MKGGVFHIGGEKLRYKDMTKGKDQIKILSTQVGGASSWTCMVHLNVHFICFVCMAQVLKFKISMLVWCMLIARLNDEMKI